MKKFNSVFFIFNLILISTILIRAVNSGDEKKNTGDKNTGESYAIHAVKLPEKMNFCSEDIPLDEQDIFERIDREIHVNTYWQSSTLLLLKRAHKYFPVIEPILKKEGIPDDFKYLAVAESSLMNVVSPSGAKGFWQFLSSTGKEYGLEINSNVDERYHLEKATAAACRYLNDAKQKFGTWTLAAASYNLGISKLSKRLEKQNVSSYYDLLLNDETSRYVPRIAVYKEILSHPGDYGFYFEEKDLYKPLSFKEVEVDTAVTDLVRFAKKYNMTYKELKILNPWLREDHLNNKTGKLYNIKVNKD